MKINFLKMLFDKYTDDVYQTDTSISLKLDIQMRNKIYLFKKLRSLNKEMVLKIK